MAKLYEISLNRHQTGMTYDEYSMLYINYHAYIKKLLNYRNYKHYNNHFILDSKDLMMVALKYGDLVKAKRIRRPTRTPRTLYKKAINKSG